MGHSQGFSQPTFVPEQGSALFFLNGQHPQSLLLENMPVHGGAQHLLKCHVLFQFDSCGALNEHANFDHQKLEKPIMEKSSAKLFSPLTESRPSSSEVLPPRVPRLPSPPAFAPVPDCFSGSAT